MAYLQLWLNQGTDSTGGLSSLSVGWENGPGDARLFHLILNFL